MGRTVEITYDVKTDDAVDATDNLKESTDDASDSQKDLQKDLKKTSEGAQKASKGFKTVGVSIGTLAKSTGIITLIAGALGILQEAFSNNQKVVDAFTTGTTALGIAFNDLFKFISDNIGTITGFFKDIFDNPQESLKALGDAIQQNLINRFNAFIDTLGLVGKAIKQVFEGDFDGAIETAKEVSVTFIDVLTGVENTVDKIVSVTNEAVTAITKYTTATLKNAATLTEQNKQLEILDSLQTRLFEQFDRQAEQQRQIRDDARVGIAERIEANKELGRILEAQNAAEQDAVTRQIDVIRRRNEDLGVTTDRLLEIFQLNTELAAIEADIEGKRSEQRKNEETLNEERKVALEELKLLGLEERERAEIEAQQDLERNRERIALFATDEEERRAFEEAAELEHKNRLAEIDKQYSEVVKKTSDGRIAQFIKENQSQINNANSLLGSVGFIFGALAELSAENFERQKKFKIAEATVDTVQGALTAFTGAMSLGPIVGPILGGVLAAAVAALGVAQIAKISNTSPESPSMPNVGTIPSTSSGAAEAAVSSQATPSGAATDPFAGFGVIQDQTPRAFVLESDVSSAQEANKKLERRATLG